jgi:hypothetical protein
LDKIYRVESSAAVVIRAGFMRVPYSVSLFSLFYLKNTKKMLKGSFSFTLLQWQQSDALAAMPADNKNANLMMKLLVNCRKKMRLLYLFDY